MKKNRVLFLVICLLAPIISISMEQKRTPQEIAEENEKIAKKFEEKLKIINDPQQALTHRRETLEKLEEEAHSLIQNDQAIREKFVKAFLPIQSVRISEAVKDKNFSYLNFIKQTYERLLEFIQDYPVDASIKNEIEQLLDQVKKEIPATYELEKALSNLKDALDSLESELSGRKPYFF